MMLLLAVVLSCTAIDGDTIRCPVGIVRLENIDAPETRRAKCPSERRLGLQAKATLAEILGRGEIAVIVGKRARDRYGRTLARVTVAGSDVGEMLIAEGLARKWTGKRRPWC